MEKTAPLPDFEIAREAMVDSQLRPQGVSDPRLVAALSRVRREQFVPEGARAVAYMDRSVPLGGGRFLAPAVSLGLLLSELGPQPGERALIVGGATGYSAAVLQAMGTIVTNLECSSELAAVARDLGIETVEGPLEEGHRSGAPYDLIIIDGAVEQIPETIIDQLADHGRLGAALIDRGVNRLIVGRKAGGGFGHHAIADSAHSSLPGFERPRAFTF